MWLSASAPNGVVACLAAVAAAAMAAIPTAAWTRDQAEQLNASIANPHFVRVNIFAADGKDPRVPQPRSGAGQVFAPIGIIVPNHPIPVTEDGKTLSSDVRATAFLVSPCLIVTNYHAVFGIGEDGANDELDNSASFYVGEDTNTGFKYNIRAVPVSHGHYSRNGTESEDWTLLQLDKCAGASADLGWIPVSNKSWAQYRDSNLYLAGYPGDNLTSTGRRILATGKILQIGGPCHFHADVDGGGAVSHDCPMSGGDSGAPIFNVTSDGSIVAVALNEGDTASTENSRFSKIFPTFSNSNKNISIDLATLMYIPSFGKTVFDDLNKWNIDNPALRIPTTTVPTLSRSDMTLGSPGARVAAIEYASVDCKPCAAFNNTRFPEFKKKYIDTGRVFYVFREAPSEQEQLTIPSYMLARCAGKERYFGVLDKFFHLSFEGDAKVNFRTHLNSIAAEAGLDAGAVNSCLGDRSAQIALSNRTWGNAGRDKIKLVPTFLVGDQRVEGITSLDALDAAITAAEAKAESAR